MISYVPIIKYDQSKHLKSGKAGTYLKLHTPQLFRPLDQKRRTYVEMELRERVCSFGLIKSNTYGISSHLIRWKDQKLTR